MDEHYFPGKLTRLARLNVGKWVNQFSVHFTSYAKSVGSNFSPFFSSSNDLWRALSNGTSSHPNALVFTLESRVSIPLLSNNNAASAWFARELISYRKLHLPFIRSFLCHHSLVPTIAPPPRGHLLRHKIAAFIARRRDGAGRYVYTVSACGRNPHQRVWQEAAHEDAFLPAILKWFFFTTDNRKTHARNLLALR